MVLLCVVPVPAKLNTPMPVVPLPSMLTVFSVIRALAVALSSLNMSIAELLFPVRLKVLLCMCAFVEKFPPIAVLPPPVPFMKLIPATS